MLLHNAQTPGVKEPHPGEWMHVGEGAGVRVWDGNYWSGWGKAQSISCYKIYQAREGIFGGTHDDFKHLWITTHCPSLLHINLEHPGKSVKISTDRKLSRRNSREAKKKQILPQNSMKYH